MAKSEISLFTFRLSLLKRCNNLKPESCRNNTRVHEFDS